MCRDNQYTEPKVENDWQLKTAMEVICKTTLPKTNYNDRNRYAP